MGAIRIYGRPFGERGWALTAAAAALAAAFALPAQAQQSNVFDDLLEKLRDKGVLSQDEYEGLKAARDDERREQRAERRRQALRAAQEDERAEKAKESAKTEMVGKSKDGLVVWQSGDGETAISINGRAQLDYRTFADNIAPNTFDIRRAYFGAKGQFGKYYSWDVTLDAAGSGAALDVAYLDAAWVDWAKLRFGQFKMPMSLEELTSSRFIDFQERSFVNSFVYGKEQGAMVFGNPWKGIGYNVALSTGEGKNTDDTVNTQDGNDWIGRLHANAAPWIGLENAVVHLGAGYGRGTHQNLGGVSLRTEGRGVTFFRTSAFAGNVERTRSDLELALSYGPVKLQGEYNTNKFEGATFAATPVNYDRKVHTYYVGLGWLITGESYASTYKSDGRFDRIRPKKNFSTDFSGWGAWELGVRYSNFDGGDFTAANAAGTGVLSSGLTNKADAYTIGLKWIPTPNTRFMLNYVKTNFDTPVTVAVSGTNQQFNDEQAITLRAQVDF